MNRDDTVDLHFDAAWKGHLWVILRAALDAVGRGLSQTDLGKVLGMAPSEVSALRRGDLRRFSAERLLRCLQRLNYDIELRLRPANGLARIRVSTESATSSAFHEGDSIMELTPGIVLIAGSSSSGRSRFLDTVIRQHMHAGASTLHFARSQRTPRTRVFTSDAEFHQLVIVAPKPAVVGIDDFEVLTDEPGWAALHFARTARVYVVVHAEDTVGALGAFAASLGGAQRYLAEDSFAEHIRAIVALRCLPAREQGALAVVRERAHVEHRDGRWQTVVTQPFDLEIQALVDSGTIDPPQAPQYSLLTSEAAARSFLAAIRTELGTYLVQPDSDDDLGIDVLNAANKRSVQIHLGRNRDRRRYDVFITTDESDGAQGERPAETRLFTAASDVAQVATLARGFLDATVA